MTMKSMWLLIYHFINWYLHIIFSSQGCQSCWGENGLHSFRSESSHSKPGKSLLTPPFSSWPNLFTQKQSLPAVGYAAWVQQCNWAITQATNMMLNWRNHHAFPVINHYWPSVFNWIGWAKPPLLSQQFSGVGFPAVSFFIYMYIMTKRTEQSQDSKVKENGSTPILPVSFLHLQLFLTRRMTLAPIPSKLWMILELWIKSSTSGPLRILTHSMILSPCGRKRLGKPLKRSTYQRSKCWRTSKVSGDVVVGFFLLNFLLF